MLATKGSAGGSVVLIPPTWRPPLSRRSKFSARQAFLLKAESGEQLLRAQAWLLRSETLLNHIEIIPFDEDVASEFDSLRRQKKLKKIGRADLLIASIALAHRATLVTRIVKHFSQIPKLRLENWAD